MRTPGHLSVLMAIQDLRVEYRPLQTRLRRQTRRTDRILTLSGWNTDLCNRYYRWGRRRRRRHPWCLVAPLLTPVSLWIARIGWHLWCHRACSRCSFTWRLWQWYRRPPLPRRRQTTCRCLQALIFSLRHQMWFISLCCNTQLDRYYTSGHHHLWFILLYCGHHSPP